MATRVEAYCAEDMDPDLSGTGPPPDLDDADAALRARMLRKRTKTGCLTCRKRRIKCGEERPICKNCIKSKRHCDGYNQRVVFKPQTVDFRHLQNGAATITFPASTMGGDFNFDTGPPYTPPSASEPAHMRPRPLMPIDPSHAFAPLGPYTAPPYQTPWHGANPFLDPSVNANLMQHMDMAQPALHAAQLHYPLTGHTPVPVSAVDLDRRQSMPDPYSVSQAYVEALNAAEQSAVPPTPGLTTSGSFGHHPPPQAPGQQGLPTSASRSSFVMPSVEHTAVWESAASSVQPPTPHTAPPGFNHWSTVPFHPDISPTTIHSNVSQSVASVDSPTQLHRPDASSPARLLEDAAVEYHDDNYYDVDIVDEPDAFVSPSPGPPPTEHQALAQILRIGSMQLHNGNSSKLEYHEGILDAYRPETTANPLQNPATAKVFAHFIHVTAPTISAHTRRPAPSPTPQHRADVPFSRQGLWTHTMPMAALGDQGLLQAMLALSSLHIAKLTGASTTPSFKHYAYALKRVHHAVGQSVKRHSVPVLAASLLLAIYELWCAEHVKWSSHLAGAGLLLIETDFAAMQRQVHALKVEKAVARKQGYPEFRNAKRQGPIPPHLKTKARQYRDLEQVPDLDAQLVSVMAGKAVNYADHGRVLDDHPRHHPEVNALDIPTYEVQKDLFWQYCKQDMIGSVISGNPLLMPFSRWTDCPPRCPIDSGAAYGAHDHLILLLGRVADYAARDRARKLRYISLNGGKWRPPPGMQLNMPGVPTGGPPHTPASQGSPGQSGNTPSPQMPPYFGMAPPPPSNGMPSSYRAAGRPPPVRTPEQEDHLDLNTATERAIAEWNGIVSALGTLISRLGDGFQPIQSDHQPRPSTPFGPATVYKSLDVGLLWSYISFAWILVHRSHPHMPPHAHMAAAVAAGQTKHFAAEIGRIAAGIMPAQSGRAITPALGAAMCDLCLPLFFSGAQTVDPIQREWIITTLFEIERRCAYDTAGVIAHGCQTAWYKAGQAGRGPPYRRRFNEKHQDIRLNGGWIKQDSSAEPNQEDVTDRRFVQTKPAARLHWAMGILGTEEDA